MHRHLLSPRNPTFQISFHESEVSGNCGEATTILTPAMGGQSYVWSDEGATYATGILEREIG